MMLERFCVVSGSIFKAGLMIQQLGKIGRRSGVRACGLRQSQLLILDLRSPYQAPTNKRVAFPSCVTYALNRYTLTHLERASPMILFSIKSETSVTSRFF